MSGCALVTGDSGDSRLIRHRPLSGYPAALLSGALVQDGPCLVVRPPSGDAIVVVWPPQYSLGGDGDQTAVVDWLGHLGWTVGDVGEIVGGEYTYASDCPGSVRPSTTSPRAATERQKATFQNHICRLCAH